jgi:hypothetical protein
MLDTVRPISIMSVQASSIGIIPFSSVTTGFQVPAMDVAVHVIVVSSTFVGDMHTVLANMIDFTAVGKLTPVIVRVDPERLNPVILAVGNV